MRAEDYFKISETEEGHNLLVLNDKKEYSPLAIFKKKEQAIKAKNAFIRDLQK